MSKRCFFGALTAWLILVVAVLGPPMLLSGCNTSPAATASMQVGRMEATSCQALVINGVVSYVIVLRDNQTEREYLVVTGGVKPDHETIIIMNPPHHP